MSFSSVGQCEPWLAPTRTAGRDQPDRVIMSAKSRQLHVAIACGGTGGHLFPGLAVAEQLLAEGQQVLILISPKDVDQAAREFHPALRVATLPAVGLPRRALSPAFPSFVLRLLAATAKSMALFLRHRTDVVLGMGGFTSAAAVWAAQLACLPTVIHESNSIPGRANRWAARRARFIACGFQECLAHFPANKGVWTGTPVRSSLRPVPREVCFEKLALDPRKPTLLIMGGSQGASALNRAVLAAWQRLGQFNLIHLTGPQDYPLASQTYRAAAPSSVCVRPFLREMEYAYSIANLAIARAGAASLTELAHFGVPSILVPYPHAADQHQRHNADILQQAGAAQLLPQDHLTPDRLAQAVQALWADEEKRRQMSRQLRSWVKPHATQQVATLLKQAAGWATAVRAGEAVA